MTDLEVATQIGAMTKALMEDERVVGIVVAGSLSRGESDKWSDIDLFVTVSACLPEDIPSFLGWVDPDQVLLMPRFRYVPDFGWSQSIVLRSSSIVQLNFNTPDAIPMNAMRRRGTIIYDPLSIQRGVQETAQALVWEAAPLLNGCYERLLFRALVGSRTLARGERLRATTYLLECVELLAMLVLARDDALDITLHWSHPLKRFEQRVGPALSVELLRRTVLHEDAFLDIVEAAHETACALPAIGERGASIANDIREMLVNEKA